MKMFQLHRILNYFFIGIQNYRNQSKEIDQIEKIRAHVASKFSKLELKEMEER